MRSLELEPDLVEGHAALAWIRMNHDRDWRGAEASYARAIELAPGNIRALRGAGALALSFGRLEDAVEFGRQALAQDPLNTANYNVLGVALHASGRLTEAEEAYRKALELSPQKSAGHSLLARTLLAQGRGEEALEEALREPDESFNLWAQAIVLHALGREEESQAALLALTDRYAETMAFQIAEVHGARGEVDAAFEWLERAYALHDPGVADTRVSEDLRALHGDPRWRPFLEKLDVVG
jgi:adenylate cyclase